MTQLHVGLQGVLDAISLSEAIPAVRRFNRFYTQKVGLLDEIFLSSGMTLAEGRVLLELATAQQRKSPREIALQLGLDAGYLSRIVARFQAEELIDRHQSPVDGQSVGLGLTEKGRDRYERIRLLAEKAVSIMIADLSDLQRGTLISAMNSVMAALSGRAQESVRLRSHRAGDLGWLAERHAVVYEREFGLGVPFERIVLDICARFSGESEDFGQKCWIAECDGERAGGVILVRAADPGRAMLRLFLVEPVYRRRGIGDKLLQAAIEHAAKAGYSAVELRTQNVLVAARKLYARHGFTLQPDLSAPGFCPNWVDETWHLYLDQLK
jgi:DNA-binding MarR family transcriptional regulator/GNAT superfamily N-acetyltransferase